MPQYRPESKGQSSKLIHQPKLTLVSVGFWEKRKKWGSGKTLIRSLGERSNNQQQLPPSTTTSFPVTWSVVILFCLPLVHCSKTAMLVKCMAEDKMCSNVRISGCLHDHWVCTVHVMVGPNFVGFWHSLLTISFAIVGVCGFCFSNNCCAGISVKCELYTLLEIILQLQSGLG